MFDLLEEQLAGGEGGKEEGKEGGVQERQVVYSLVCLVGCVEDLDPVAPHPPTPPKEVAALESCALRRAGPDKGARGRPLGAAVGRTDRARVAARGLGQMGLFHPPLTAPGTGDCHCPQFTDEGTGPERSSYLYKVTQHTSNLQGKEPEVSLKFQPTQKQSSLLTHCVDF